MSILNKKYLKTHLKLHPSLSQCNEHRSSTVRVWAEYYTVAVDDQTLAVTLAVAFCQLKQKDYAYVTLLIKH